MEKHIKDMEIYNFKGLKELKIKDMKPINIFIGDNNSGKTTVLEAIAMFEKPFDYMSHLKLLDRKHGLSNIKYENIKQIFYNLDYDNEIEINLNMNNIDNNNINNKASLKIDAREEDVFYMNNKEEVDLTTLTYTFNNQVKEFSIQNDPLKEIRVKKEKFKYLNVGFVSPIDTYMEKSTLSAIDTVIKEGKKKTLIDLLKIFDNNITDLNYISNKELYITTNNRGTLSISSFGDGLKKAIVLIAKAIDAKGGIVLIDELETSIHKDILGKIFKGLLTNAKEYNTQIISTTHSLEAIRELLINLEQNLDSLALYRLEEFEGKIYATRFSGKKAYRLIIKEGGDLR